MENFAAVRVNATSGYKLLNFLLDTLNIVAQQVLELTVDTIKHNKAPICVFPFTPIQAFVVKTVQDHFPPAQPSVSVSGFTFSQQLPTGGGGGSCGSLMLRSVGGVNAA